MVYYIMWKDIPTIEFNLETLTVKFLNRELAPFCVRNMQEDFSVVRVFCSNRMLMVNRVYCKEILTSCGVDDQTDVGICIMSRALSFRDNYWIKHKDSQECWDKINLYSNEFSNDIGITALTGECCTVNIGDEYYTGELTNKGTRAKCYYRQGAEVYLIKNETLNEIIAEVLSYYIAKELGLDSATYAYMQFYGKDCSVCKIETSEDYELLLCRSVLQHYKSDMKYNSPYYRMFMEADKRAFLLMQIFDYVTLNTDRNRDNFGLLLNNNKVLGLYPLFDHDSCFKGKSTSAYYFVTGMSFNDTLNRIHLDYPIEFESIIIPAVKSLRDWLLNNPMVFEEYLFEKQYNSMLFRVDDVLSLSKEDTSYEVKCPW